MQTILVLFYAFLSMNVSQIDTKFVGEGMEEGEFSQQKETGDDIRNEVQSNPK